MNCMDSSNDNNNRVGSFWTCDELLAALPQVQKLKEIFKLYVRPIDSSSIDILKVPECLRAMGLHFVETSLKKSLMERIEKFPQIKPPTRVSFELVIYMYCQLASKVDVPSADAMINGLRCCDSDGTGLLPYKLLYRMLTTLGERLNGTEVSDLLDSIKEDGDNINYINLLETMFSSDKEAADKLRQARLYLDTLGKNACHMDMMKRDEFIKALRDSDNTQSGYIAVDQLLHILNCIGDHFTESELSALTRRMTNVKKEVDYRMFLSLIMNE